MFIIYVPKPGKPLNPFPCSFRLLLQVHQALVFHHLEMICANVKGQRNCLLIKIIYAKNQQSFYHLWERIL